ncbi:unnamed protein product [Angiostrongylus costaricensis]|uniref:Uncharacterized protein n=1 Tax=Angiostrongylus costaricensis TaxID=334426 RepID=A0A0R3PJ54_ANGCS|nr:unnamed protein product [Angiostrongylus costaricensis]
MTSLPPRRLQKVAGRGRRRLRVLRSRRRRCGLQWCAVAGRRAVGGAAAAHRLPRSVAAALSRDRSSVTMRRQRGVLPL